MSKLFSSLTNYTGDNQEEEEDAHSIRTAKETTQQHQQAAVVSPESKSSSEATSDYSPSSKENKKKRNHLRGIAMISDGSTNEEDDDDEDDSSLGYSDDSASFSDAYFHPQAAGDAPHTYGRLVLNGPVNPYQTPLHGSQSTYGSLGYSNNSGGGLSQFWLGGTIQEDVEAVAPYHHSSGQSSQSGEETSLLSSSNNPRLGKASAGKRDRKGRPRNNKSRQLQQIQRKHREHAAREKAVSRIRGKPQQVSSWQDSPWAILFVLQLLVVVLCALRFGFGVILFKDSWYTASSTAVAGTWQQPDSVGVDGGNVIGSDNAQDGDDPVTRFLAETAKIAAKTFLANASTAVINGNSTNDDDVAVVPSNATLKDILFSQDDAFTKTDDEVDATTDDAEDSGSFTIDYKNVLAITFFAGFYACILSYISFGFMLILARSLILIMLIFSILVALAWGIIGLTLDPYGVISVMGFAALISTLGYTMYSWHRIPFAATNLYTALTAMRCTADITVLGLLSLVVAFGWCLLWSMAFIGIVNAYNDNDCDTKDACQAHVSRNHVPLYLLLLLSFHWTTMVIKNVVRVTVASAIGTWWFTPNEIGPFCTSAVVRPLLRSLTLSLGSICLGSLIISPAQWTLSLCRFCCCCADVEPENFTCIGQHDGSSYPGRPQSFMSLQNGGDHDEGTGVVADPNTTVDSAADTVGLFRRFRSLVQPCQHWLRSCNRWSFTYIGLYSYSFVEAGERALQLFETRGWMEVVEDPLIQNVLLMASVVIGGSTGVFAVVVEETDGFDFTSFHQPIITAFVIGSVLGYVLSNILLLGVVGSAVNTVLVCFAAGPFDFDKNHPRLSREMREVWSQQVWEPAPVVASTPAPLSAPATTNNAPDLEATHGATIT